MSCLKLVVWQLLRLDFWARYSYMFGVLFKVYDARVDAFSSSIVLSRPVCFRGSGILGRDLRLAAKPIAHARDRHPGS